jgi:hypothetical protein
MLRLLRLSVLSVVLVAAGCGSDLCTVSGVVTFNGADLPTGVIVFRDPAGQVAPEAGKIVNGRYQLQVKPGKKVVEITADRQTKFNKAMNQYEREQYIPERYHGPHTQLKAVVDLGKANEFKFELNDKP